MMDEYDNAPAALRDLLKEFEYDEIVKAGTAIGSKDYEAIGRFLHATLRMTDKTKMRLGEAFMQINGRRIR